MAICMYCNSTIPDGTKFCPHCGAALPVEAAGVSSYGQPADNMPQPPYQQPTYQQQDYQQQQQYAQPQPTYAAPAQAVNDSGSIGWGILGFLFPIVGLVLFLVWRNNKPKCAKVAGIGALISVCINIVVLVMSGGSYFA